MQDEIKDKPKRKGKPIRRNKNENIYIKVTADVKQDFYDIADVKGWTLTKLFETMVEDYKNQYLRK